jgi:hypothetical protein
VTRDIKTGPCPAIRRKTEERFWLRSQVSAGIICGGGHFLLALNLKKERQVILNNLVKVFKNGHIAPKQRRA